jgi:ABC-type transport system involved in cytochrome bd biosynthesis fused ATPase/permease subunit
VESTLTESSIVNGHSTGINPTSERSCNRHTSSRGTVGDNIRYGRLDASQEEIEEAARLVNAHQFIIQP